MKGGFDMEFFKVDQKGAEEKRLRSEDLVKEIEKLDQKIPELLKRKEAETEEKLMPILREVDLWRRAGSFPGKIRDLDERARKTKYAIDAPLQNVTAKRDSLVAEVRSLSWPLIKEFCESCLSELKHLEKVKKVEVAKKQLNILTGDRTVILFTNEGAIREAQQKLIDARKKVSEMELKDISAIQTEIDRSKAEFQAFDLSKMEQVEIPRHRLNEVLAIAEPDNLETVYPFEQKIITKEGAKDEVLFRRSAYFSHK
jgi:hypothetical protein